MSDFQLDMEVMVISDPDHRHYYAGQPGVIVDIENDLYLVAIEHDKSSHWFSEDQICDLQEYE